MFFFRKLVSIINEFEKLHTELVFLNGFGLRSCRCFVKTTLYSIFSLL